MLKSSFTKTPIIIDDSIDMEPIVGKTKVTNKDVKEILKNFDYYKKTIEQKFIITDADQQVVEYLERLSLYCPFSKQSEELMKSVCYAELIKSNIFSKNQF